MALEYMGYGSLAEFTTRLGPASPDLLAYRKRAKSKIYDWFFRHISQQALNGLN